MTVYLAFYKGRPSIFARLIRWWTASPYSHVEIAIPLPTEGWYLCLSSDEADGGTRGKVMYLGADWELVAVPGVDLERLWKWCLGQLGKKYDRAGIIGMVARPKNDDPDKWFCSEFCLRALQEAGWPVQLVPEKTAPGDLYVYVMGMGAD